MFIILIYFIIIAMAALMVGMLRQHSIASKLLFFNSCANTGVILVLLLGTLENCESYIDIALIYVLLNFISTKAFLYYLIKSKNNI